MVLVAGGTGLVGGFLIQQLILADEVEKIFAITRRPLAIEHSKIVPLNADFANLDKDLQALPKLDIVFCCLGTTIKKAGSQQSFREVDFDYVLSLGKWAKAKAISRFLLVSGQGANKDSWFFYAKVKGQIEEALRNLQLPSLSIVRPALLLGPRSEKRLGEVVAARFAHFARPIFKGPLKRYQSIQAQTVAQSLCHVALFARAEKFQVYESERIELTGQGASSKS